MNSDLKFWLGFSQIRQIGPKNFQRLIKHFASMEQAWQANSAELMHAGINPKLAEDIVISRPEVDLNNLIAELVQNHVQVVTMKDENYPERLRQIHTAPPLLYFRGELKKDPHIISIVGTRKMTPYGKSVVEDLINELTEHNITVVSGMAFGIDAQVHLVCLENNCRTIAVLASGLDDQNIYPAQNRYIAQKIIKNNGLIISEYPLFTMPHTQYFPMRNRIIAGLSDLTIVIEAAERSGSLITATQALEFNRDVGAVPGSIYENTSAGCNKLLKDGAYPITSADDILTLLNLDKKDTNKIDKIKTELSTDEIELLDNLSKNPITLDNLVIKMQKPIQQILSLVTQLEIKNLVERAAGNTVILK